MAKGIKVKDIREDKMGTLLECLRYAGIIHSVEERVVEKGDHDHTYYTFVINAPKGAHETTWKDMNVRRMSTFQLRVE